jgi:hypothetical protein
MVLYNSAVSGNCYKVRLVTLPFIAAAIVAKAQTAASER